MVEDPEQTPAQDGETSQTPAKKEGIEKEELFTKAQLTELIQKEVGKVTAKHSKKYSDLEKALEEEKRKNLPDSEKFKKDIEDKDKLIKAKDQELSKVQLENMKIRALIKAGADPEKLDALLKRVIGTSQEEIETDVAELKELGLITSQTNTDKTSQSQISKKVGGGSQHPTVQPPTLEDQLVAAYAAKDATKVIALKRQIAARNSEK